MAPVISPQMEILLAGNLGYFDSPLPEALRVHLRSILQTAILQLHDPCGVEIDKDDLQDVFLTVMYATWLYYEGRKGGAKPPMLRQAILDRQISQAILDRQISQAKKKSGEAAT